MIAEIKKSVLAQQVEEGWKRKALAEHYGIPETQMAEVLRKAGLKIRKFHAPKYQFIDDTESETTEGIVEGTDIAVGEDVNVLQEENTQEEITTQATTQEPAAGW
jgi:uncharacterized protein (DUF433 family)